MSRPRTLNFLKRTQACTLAAAGRDAGEIARDLGCSLRTLRRELARDPEFRRQLQDAERSAAFDPLAHMRRQARRHWRAAAWLLERTEPQAYAPRRAAPFRPAQLETACLRLIEAALEETPDMDHRTRLYRRLRAVADQAHSDLLAGNLARARRPGASRVATPLADVERMHAELDQSVANFSGSHDGPPSDGDRMSLKNGQNWTKWDNSSPGLPPAPASFCPQNPAPAARAKESA